MGTTCSRLESKPPMVSTSMPSPRAGYSRRKSSNRKAPLTRHRPGASFSMTKRSASTSERILRIQQEGAGIQDADDGIGRLVVKRQTSMLMFTGGGDHVFDGEIIGNGGHLGTRLHHFAGDATIEVDDLENDFFL